MTAARILSQLLMLLLLRSPMVLPLHMLPYPDPLFLFQLLILLLLRFPMPLILLLLRSPMFLPLRMLPDQDLLSLLVNLRQIALGQCQNQRYDH